MSASVRTGLSMHQAALQPGNSDRDPVVTGSELLLLALQPPVQGADDDMQPLQILAPAAVLLSITLAAAGCGGGSGSPPVASVAGNGTTTSAAPSAGAGSGSPSGGAGGFTLKMQGGLAFSRCMRAHGIANFPDPGSDGTLNIGSSSGIDPGTAKFQSALQACQKLTGGGGKPPSPAELAKAKQQALAFSACMRRHGLADFPDPDFRNGGISIRLRSGPGSDLDPHSPTFQAASRACRGFFPGKPGAPGAKAVG